VRPQSGGCVVRPLLPPGRTDDAVVWDVRPHRIPGWVRPPVVAHAQAGYHPDQPKVAVIELDPAGRAEPAAGGLRLGADGSYREALRADVEPWGRWYRYDYARLDFSAVREPG